MDKKLIDKVDEILLRVHNSGFLLNKEDANEIVELCKAHYLKAINNNYGGFTLVVDGKKQKMFTEDEINGAM